jgi:putative tricarboxylic transport membrane protein
MEIIGGFVTLFGDGYAVLFVLLAAWGGLLAGALPGLTTAAAIAMLVPVTYYLEPLWALIFLYVIGKSGRFGGSIAAILFNTPGTASAAATQFDGHPLARQGKAVKAMKVSTIASVIGDTLGELLLLFGAVFVAAYTRKMGPPEYFAVYSMAFLIIGSVIGKSIVKGLLSTLLGILVAMVGIDPITANERLNFGTIVLMDGFSLVPLLIGLFVVSEVFTRIEEGTSAGEGRQIAARPKSKADNRLSWEECKMCLPVIFRSSFMGAVIGILPGLGSSVSCFVAYGEEKRRAKRPELWGNGAIEGVAAPEAANNAVSGPSMIPLLTLGVPGTTIAAMLMGVFMIHGIQIGPNIFVNSSELVYALIASGFLGILVYGLTGYFGSNLVGRLIAKAPLRIIYPLIFLLGFIAAYSVRSAFYDISMMCLFGMIGYAMRKLEFSPPAFIISFILAGGAEEALRQSLLLSERGGLIFLERPVSLVFFGIGAAVILLRARKAFRKSRAQRM